MNYLDGLNAMQLKAVTHKEGPLLVIAGPGSGKTRVLTMRIAHLIDSGVAPWEILTLTFTNKAAKEMKERISKVVGNAANQIWAGTFHSIFAKILRVEAPKLGFPSNFSIYDPSDVKSALSEIIKSQGMDIKTYTPNDIYHKISMAKNLIINPEKYASDGERLLKDKQDGMPYIYKIYDLYVKKLQRSGAMDFDDLLFQMHRLFKENPDQVLEKYRKKFKYILVDEFQDTNSLQSEIIKFLTKFPESPQNICVVGDDAQSIYAFRGATIQNILNFERDFPGLTIYKLEQNYRSTHHIVQAANDVIAKNNRQIRKVIFTEKGVGEPIQVLKASSDNEESRMVVSKIMELKLRNHLSNQDIAILYRVNAQSRVFEESLKNMRIAYRIFGGTSFYERKEIKDVVSYLRVVANPDDEEALKRIVNYPTRGIGDTSIAKLSEIAEKNGLSLWNIMMKMNHFDLGISARTQKSIQDFINMIHVFQRWAQEFDAYEVARRVVKSTEIIEDLNKEKTPEAQGRVENVQELLDGIKTFTEEDNAEFIVTEIQDKSLSSYLQNIALVTDADKDQNDQDTVKLMSVHAAKGLEFKAVFVTGMEENLFPSQMAIRSVDSRSAIDEERRLFYVAITRAEHHLYLSYASSRYRFGKMQYNSSSRFLEEISENCFDQIPISTKSVVTGAKLGPKPAVGLHKPATLPQGVEIKASPVHMILPGVFVLHERFGKGKVLQLDGKIDNKVATIIFEAGVGEKKIMLKFAKLQVVD